ncbi:hypothetical protein [Sphaerotilus uruguayifluvii]|uniref:Uncharacterized protein n=1 Tax=Sphaerotilus uruguayifluvii TaxID=2735897 RepID=A0ABX2G8G2_9BURK|nr:hypothetical protein [Leptothrix sp. C29]NRT58623.1 hypothetical protein [Leptothrix sp. C29]
MSRQRAGLPLRLLALGLAAGASAQQRLCRIDAQPAIRARVAHHSAQELDRLGGSVVLRPDANVRQGLGLA